MTITTTHETPYMAQRRKLASLKEKQDAGEEVIHEENKITPQAAKRRAAEASAMPKASKKVSKKKSKTTGS